MSARGRKLELGKPYGAAVLQLPAATREKVRRALLVSTTETDAEIAGRLPPPVTPEHVAAMRERLEGLGVIAAGSKPVKRRPRMPKPSDNYELFDSMEVQGG